MNTITIISLGCLLAFAFLFFKEFTKKPTPKQTPHPPTEPPKQQMTINEIRSQQTQNIPKQNYKEVYNKLSKEMQEKKETISPQARQHLSNPREALKTVDTNFQQAKAKMWGLSPLKTPTEPQNYDLKKDTTMLWNRKQPTIYMLLSIISFILFLMLGV